MNTGKCTSWWGTIVRMYRISWWIQRVNFGSSLIIFYFYTQECHKENKFRNDSGVQQWYSGLGLGSQILDHVFSWCRLTFLWLKLSLKLRSLIWLIWISWIWQAILLSLSNITQSKILYFLGNLMNCSSLSDKLKHQLICPGFVLILIQDMM